MIYRYTLFSGSLTDNTKDIFLTTHPSLKQRCTPMLSIRNNDLDIVLLDTPTTVKQSENSGTSRDSNQTSGV